MEPNGTVQSKHRIIFMMYREKQLIHLWTPPDASDNAITHQQNVIVSLRLGSFIGLTAKFSAT